MKHLLGKERKMEGEEPQRESGRRTQTEMAQGRGEESVEINPENLFH